MKILFIAMADSIHTTRWIKQFSDQGWDIHLFPCMETGTEHPELENVTIHHVLRISRQYSLADKVAKKVDYAVRGVKPTGLDCKRSLLYQICLMFLRRLFPNFRIFFLNRILKKHKFDLVHSMEIQHAGYLTAALKRYSQGRFPPWLLTNWGSDICLLGRLLSHRARVTQVLEACDFYSAECERDIGLARHFGFKGTTMPVIPATGGFEMHTIASVGGQQRPSERRKIMLKGYQSWAGRALFGLRALEECADLLKDYEVVIYSAGEEVQMAAELFTQRTKIPTKILPLQSPHAAMLRAFGEARLYLGLSIGDGISTSLLESMAMGAFPIQSDTSCANEWVVDGKSGFIVPPEDIPRAVRCVRSALLDDELVDEAAQLNLDTIKRKAEWDFVRSIAIESYKSIVAKCEP